jgi:hypothetical protein
MGFGQLAGPNSTWYHLKKGPHRAVCGLHAAGVAVLTKVEQVAPQEIGAHVLHGADAPLLQIGLQVANL